MKKKKVDMAFNSFGTEMNFSLNAVFLSFSKHLCVVLGLLKRTREWTCIWISAPVGDTGFAPCIKYAGFRAAGGHSEKKPRYVALWAVQMAAWHGGTGTGLQAWWELGWCLGSAAR